jgi:hypothetical protein
MKRVWSRIAAAAGFIVTALPAVAAAQDQVWLQDRRYGEGIGIRSGDFELHPGAALEFGYDSNYYHRYGGSAEPTVGSLRLRLTPSFSFSTLTQRRRGGGPEAAQPEFEFRGGMSLTYHEFFPLYGDPGGVENMKSERNVSGLLDLTLNILPGRPWSGTIYGDIGRSITPTNQGFTAESFNRINARAGAEIVWQPGGGLLDWRLGYRFTGTIFESSQYSPLTNIENMLQTRGRWRFLPQTALVYDAKFSFLTYTVGDKAAHPLRTQIGFNGLITPSFSVLALIGWGSTFYTSPSDQHNFDSVIGQVEVKWHLSPAPTNDPGTAAGGVSAVTLGFIRDFQDSYIGTYFERDRGYINAAYLFGGRFLVVADAGVGPIIYPATEDFGGVPGWTDVRVDASLFGEYRIKDYFGINATLRYGGNLSSQAITAPGPDPIPDYLGYNQFEAYLGGRWFM